MLDIIFLAVLVFFVWRGYKKGLVMTLSGVVGLVAGLFIANYIAARVSGPISKIIVPYVEMGMRAAAKGNQFDGTAVDSSGNLFADARDSLAGIMAAAGLPKFSVLGILDRVGAEVLETGENLLRAASELIAARIMHVVAFVSLFGLLQVFFFFFFRAIDLVAKIPVVNGLNKWGGGILGLAKGVLILTVAIWVAYTFTPYADHLDSTYTLQYVYQLTSTTVPLP